MSWLLTRGLSAPSTSSLRLFSTTVPVLKKSNRARGASRKSPRNAAIFAALSSKDAPVIKTSKKATSTLDPKEGETLLSLEQACEQLQAHDAEKRPNNAFEVHIVTTVSTHQTNALRGRISFPRDPRIKQEKLLIFAEEESEVTEAVQGILEKEKEVNPQAEPSIILGASHLIASVLNNKVSGFTKVLCTQSLLGEVSKSLARSLGPKGLMPNPRRGTVVPADDREKILKAIKEARGATDWRSDKVGVVRGAIGRLNFEKEDVRKNVKTLVDAIVEKVPTLGTQSSAAAAVAANMAKEYTEREVRSPGDLKRAAGMIKQIHLSSTQGPAYKLDLRNVLI